MKKALLALSLFGLLSCATHTGSTSSLAPAPSDSIPGGHVDTGSDYEEAGLTPLKQSIEKLATTQKYSNAIEYRCLGIESDVVDYFGDHYFYEDNLTDPEASFGLAEEANGGKPNVFRFYVEEDECVPSLYHYTTLSGDLAPMEEVFGPFGVAGLHNFYQEALDELTGIAVGVNEFLITSSSTYQIFQYMTQIGSGISSIMTACRYRIINPSTNEVEITIELGDQGYIRSELTPLTESPFDYIDEGLTDGSLQGIAYHPEVVETFETDLAQDNYSFTFQIEEEGTIYPGTFEGKLCQNYFLIDYSDQYNDGGYADFGFAYFPSNVTIPLESQSNGVYAELSSSTLHYSACYEFDLDREGNVHFLSLIGPKETDELKFVQVATKDDLDNLTADQLNEGYLYIVEDDNYAYQYQIVNAATGEYGFTPYSEWYDTVGDFYIDNASATFYCSSAMLCDLSRYYLEKQSDGVYFTTDSSFVSLLASSLFGWGYIAGTSWQSYADKAVVEIKEDGVDISLEVPRPNGAGTTVLTMMIKDIGTTTIPEVENAYNQLLEVEA